MFIPIPTELVSPTELIIIILVFTLFFDSQISPYILQYTLVELGHMAFVFLAICQVAPTYIHTHGIHLLNLIFVL